MFTSTRCHQKRKVFKNALWQNVHKEKAQVLFDRMNNYTDHLGNIRLSYTQDPQTGILAILEEQHYYPFGLQHKNYRAERQKTARWAVLANEPACRADITKIDREEALKTLKEAAPPSVPLQNPGYMYKFQGQERQDEFGLGWDSFKWRNYDYALGRFMSIDPLAEEYMDWGPYVFSGNRVIDARELEGLEPYVVTGRSFIPDKTLANPNPFSKTKSFAGDNRSNYQLNTTAYRTEQKVRVDFDNNKATTLSNRANSTTGYDKNGNVTETSDPGKAGPTPTYTMDGNTSTVNMEVDASNKLVDRAPSINYDVGVTITQNEDGSFSFELKGETDGFPAYEFFITNEKDGKSYQIYGSNPNTTGDGPFSLYPPMEKDVNASGSSTTTTPVEEEK